MSATIIDGNKQHRIYVLGPDGGQNLLNPGNKQELKPGLHQLASLEPPPVVPTPHRPAPAEIMVANVGQETIVFVSMTDDDDNFLLKEGQKHTLVPGKTYTLHSIHIA